MHNISSSRELKEAIRLLEEKQLAQGLVLKEQFLVVVESIRPVNIIKSTFSEVASSPDLIGNMLSTTVGLAVGYLSNKTLVGSSANMIRRLMGTLIQFGVTTLIARNPEAVKSFGQSILHRFLSKRDIDS